MGALALDGAARAGHRVDPRRARGHDRGDDLLAPDREGLGHRDHRGADRPGGRGVRRGSVHRRAVLRLARGPAGAEEAVPDHARAVPGGDRRDRVLDHVPHVRDLPLLHRRRHRRRVRGHQLRHRRAHTGAAARHGRPDHQRLVLARHGGRRGALDRAAQRQPLRCRRGLAARVRTRRRARHRHPARPAPRTGEPALDVHPRQARRRGGAGLGHRARRQGVGRRRDAEGAEALDQGAGAGERRLPAHRQDGVRRLPAAHDRRAGAVHRPGLPLQRRLLHLRPRARHVLRRQAGKRGLVHHPVRARQLPRAAGARAAVRHRRAQADDRRHLHRLGRPADHHRVPVQGRRVDGDDPDRGVERDLLLRVGGRQLGVPDRERDLPDGDARAGDRVLLCGRHRHRRHNRAAAVRQARRDGQGDQRLLGLHPRRRADDHRRHRAGGAGHRGGQEEPGGRGHPAVGGGGRRGRGDQALGPAVLLLAGPVVLVARARRGHRRGGGGPAARAGRGGRRRPQPRRARPARELPPLGPRALPPRAGDGPGTGRDPADGTRALRGGPQAAGRT